MYLCIIWSWNWVMCTTQLPQLVRGHVVLCSQRMVVPTIAKSIQVILQAREEHKVAAEEVCIIGNAEEALFFKVAENIIVDACYSCPQGSPQPLNPVKCFLLFFLIHNECTTIKSEIYNLFK